MQVRKWLISGEINYNVCTDSEDLPLFLLLLGQMLTSMTVSSSQKLSEMQWYFTWGHGVTT